jgi:HEPN domain-containing protein
MTYGNTLRAGTHLSVKLSVAGESFMADSPDHHHWVAKAEEDVATVRLLATQDIAVFGAIVAFHCQQAAEKYLKACLRERNVDFPKVHDFERLLRLCESLSSEFDAIGDAAARLQPFAVQARYSFRNLRKTTVEQAVADMQAVREVCRKHLGVE